jgi:uncharacterized protein YigE (DUF2233 family)
MKINQTFIVVFFGAAQFASAQWIEKASNTEKSSVAGLVHRQVQFENSATSETATVELALFSPKSNVLRVVDNLGGNATLADAMAAAGCLAGVNGGYFDPNFAPLGLRVEQGKTVRPLIRARLMTGVLISSPDATQILRVGEYSAKRKPSAAVQCGPLLVDAGHPVKGLDATRMARRTFAAVGSDHAALGLCSDISLAHLSELLAAARLGEDFKVSRALNLDGGSSSAFWFKRGNGGPFSISEMKNVRDFVGIAPKED